ncbi:hypothetical protein [Amycolatopsis sp. BJA-103]|uniref:hypothetical protein n=1 Tax=Amycolatopsis sp. BJA-103 TaxID=1911175 RepID=UPI000C9B946B|nr:hypothetical protein [Amycolatopsis sp. BJA-103]PNE16064.1 hypothetical protein B1H26_27605 [Amycolatopsis sp. BJA-103]
MTNGCEDYLFQLEEQCFTRGPRPCGDRFLGSMTRLAQTLRLRDYPGLRVTCRIFPGENHYSAVPSVVNSGLRHLYGTA